MFFSTTLQAAMRIQKEKKCMQHNKDLCAMYLQISAAQPVRSFVYGKCKF